MGSTYLTLTNNVLRKLNEVELDSSTFADVRGLHAAAKDSVNWAIAEINDQQFEWPFNVANGSQTLTIGQEEYDWPDDLKVVDWHSFYIEKDDSLNIETRNLKFINRDEWIDEERELDFDSESDGREPPKFVFQGQGYKFGVSPSPDKAYTIHYIYYSEPTKLVNHSDTALIPSAYDHTILHGCLAYMYDFLDNDSRASTYERRFEKGIGRMRTILINRPEHIRDMMIRTGGYSHQRTR